MMEKEFLPSFRSEVIKYRGYDLQTYRFGNGEKIILALPSFPHSGIYFTYLLQKTHLIDRLTFVTFDLPGWAGYTDAEIFTQEKIPKKTYVNIVKEVCKHYDIKEFNLLGYSFGGSIALAVADQMRDRVQKIVLVSAVVNGKLARRTIRYKMVDVAKMLKLGWFLKKYILYKFQSVVRVYKQSEDIPHSFWEKYEDMLSNINSKVLLDSLWHLFHDDCSEELEQLDTGRFLIVNSRDELKLFRRQGEYLRRKLSHEKSIYIGGTHDDFILRSDRKAVAEVLKFFL